MAPKRGSWVAGALVVALASALSWRAARQMNATLAATTRAGAGEADARAAPSSSDSPSAGDPSMSGDTMGAAADARAETR